MIIYEARDYIVKNIKSCKSHVKALSGLTWQKSMNGIKFLGSEKETVAQQLVLIFLNI